jgi:hypothetical protein
MTSRPVYIVVLGVIAMTGILSAAFAAKLDSNTTVITGALVVAGVAVGALATMARDFHEEVETLPLTRPYTVTHEREPVGGWPEHGWPTPGEDPTKPNPTVE